LCNSRGILENFEIFGDNFILLNFGNIFVEFFGDIFCWIFWRYFLLNFLEIFLLNFLEIFFVEFFWRYFLLNCVSLCSDNFMWPNGLLLVWFAGFNGWVKTFRPFLNEWWFNMLCMVWCNLCLWHKFGFRFWVCWVLWFSWG